MLLHCTLVSAPGSSALSREPVELSVAIPSGCPGADLQAAVSRRYGTGGLFVQGVAVAALTVGVAPLVHGAVLIDGFTGASPRAAAGQPPKAALILAVHSGPGAGTIAALRRGRFRIGRGGAEIAIPDAELSRDHARLEVSDSAVTIVDLGSSNGTSVDGRMVRESAVTTGSIIRCGDSTMSLIFGTVDASGDVPDCVLAAAGSNVAEPLLVRNTVGQGNRAALVLAATVPLVIGIGLALATGTWMFLALTAASAFSVVVPALSGRHQRRERRADVAAAMQRDKERRRRAAPSAAELCVRAASGGPGPVPPAGRTAPVWLRLGLAGQAANLRLEPADPRFQPPPLGLMPLTLDPSAVLTTVHGPRRAVAGLVRSFTMQLAGYPLACRTRLLIHGSPESLPFAARFLPAVALSANGAATAAMLAAGPGEGYDHGLLIILDMAPTPSDGTVSHDANGTATLCAVASGHGWRVIDCSQDPDRDRDPSSPAGPGIVLGGHSARLVAGSAVIRFVPDLVPPLVFDRFCRRSGSAAWPTDPSRAAIPRRCALEEVLALSAADISRRWERGRRTHGLPVPVGAGSAGPIYVDVEADGPHFLVAGTTGSGKSEFLRTLAAALAASHAPDRLNLLFVDFKGGSGLGPLTGLPHCVGVLTDLGANGMGRALVSLRAEVRRREELLAAAHVPDLATYESRDGPADPLPHLLLVIDEFRILVEDAPEALSELMRIATIGRSLGIHLIMATQRPQGALTADIRANVTSCVALRVQSDLESMDVMNSRLAAGIPIASPGRAFLTRGSGAPEEFQTATITPQSAAAGAVTVETAKDVFVRAPVAAPHSTDDGPGPRPGETLTPAQAAASLVEVTAGLWRALGGAPPRRPIADPLPARLPYPVPKPRAAARLHRAPEAEPGRAVGHDETAEGTVRLGLVDLPEEQRVTELGWSPAGHGHLGLIGGAAGGADQALALVMDQLLAAETETHLYFLDSAGSFLTVADSPRVGAVAGLHELRRAVRVLELLTGEMTRRLSALASRGSPRLVLVLCGWGAWVSALRSGPLAWAEDLVLDIVRDGSKAGITVVVSGERELVTSRFFAAVPNRVFFPAGSTEEGRLTWPRLPALESLPGRVAVFGAFTGNTGPGSPAPAGHVCQLFETPGPGRLRTPPAVRSRPFRVEALPRLVSVAELRTRWAGAKGTLRAAQLRGAPFSAVPAPAPAGPAGTAEHPLWTPPRNSLCIGVAGDELQPFTVPLPGGSVLAVLGGAGSGKSTLLAALPGLNPAAGWLAPDAGTEPEAYWSGVHASALAGTLDSTAVALADDIDLLSEATNARLLALNSLGWTVILTAGFDTALSQRVPLAVKARNQGRGILIRPRTPVDGDVFGVRFELEHNPPPGRAVAIFDGQATAVQLAVNAQDNPRDIRQL